MIIIKAVVLTQYMTQKLWVHESLLNLLFLMFIFFIRVYVFRTTKL